MTEVASPDATAMEVPTTTTIESSNPTTTDVVSPDKSNDASLPPAEPVSEDTLKALSRQLEYYFSTVNLSKDTYLRTLRELNDGYVPATILANFAKVQSLCPVDSYSGVIKAATDHSDHLEVVHVDKESSKQVPEKGLNTLLAVGPIDMKPIELPVAPTPIHPTVPVPLPDLAVAANPSLPPGIQNTVILREVPDGVTEDDIRLLFDFEKCPPIQEIHEDLASYWFVTFSTSSRDDMMNVILALRSKTLKEEVIKSRLKSVTVPSATATEFIPQIYAGDRNLSYNPMNKNGANGGFVNSKRSSVQQQQAPRSPEKDGKKSARRNHRRLKGEGVPATPSSPLVTKPVISQAPPPPLVESQFPSLEAPSVVIKPQQPPQKEEVDDEDKPMSSDGASTATTSTSSSIVGEVSKPKAPGGYAAALLKAKPPAPPLSSFAKVESSKTDKTNGKKMKNGNNKKDTIPKVIEEKKPTSAVEKTKVVPMSWGGGRSFADVIKKNKEVGGAKS